MERRMREKTSGSKVGKVVKAVGGGVGWGESPIRVFVERI